MADLFDVAEFVLEDLGASSTMKLQKIVFYSHAYHLVRTGEPLVDEKIEAWANGPIFPALFDKHRRSFVVSRGFFSGFAKGAPLKSSEVIALRAALGAFRDMTGAELSELTHSESPWADARKGLAPAARSHNQISDESIMKFYSSLSCANPLFAR
ncbi:Panacea domain-containing protein [uncultured Adlercreutzia sp.]|uniref:Panacea domain-containing protein n=1 Tax=uncultured Adlercreutzia sp. TaxID=875803 RepID=UPI0025D30F08|nr:type II toxin-antitoxin system antitoxin SocA domain-containing protein [uncultured Adlercreutzia sp.]